MRLAAAVILANLAQPALADEPVDLELVLAVDASASVDETEFALQLGGMASAFRDKTVQAAIAGGALKRIAVAVTVWGDATVPQDQSSWYGITTPQDAEAFAAMLDRFPRRVTGGTGIGAGLGHAMRMFDRNGFQGSRQVVDVSGDGKETPPRAIVLQMPDARSMAHARGVTINGLAILTDDATLSDWYRNEVATGAGSFVMSCSNYDDFAEAIRRKLIREIEGRPMTSMLDGLHAVGATAAR